MNQIHSMSQQKCTLARVSSLSEQPCQGGKVGTSRLSLSRPLLSCLLIACAWLLVCLPATYPRDLNAERLEKMKEIQSRFAKLHELNDRRKEQTAKELADLRKRSTAASRRPPSSQLDSSSESSSEVVADSSSAAGLSATFPTAVDSQASVRNMLEQARARIESTVAAQRRKLAITSEFSPEVIANTTAEIDAFVAEGSAVFPDCASLPTGTVVDPTGTVTGTGIASCSSTAPRLVRVVEAASSGGDDLDSKESIYELSCGFCVLSHIDFDNSSESSAESQQASKGGHHHYVSLSLRYGQISPSTSPSKQLELHLPNPISNTNTNATRTSTVAYPLVSGRNDVPVLAPLPGSLVRRGQYLRATTVVQAYVGYDPSEGLTRVVISLKACLNAQQMSQIGRLVQRCTPAPPVDIATWLVPVRLGNSESDLYVEAMRAYDPDDPTAVQAEARRKVQQAQDRARRRLEMKLADDAMTVANSLGQVMSDQQLDEVTRRAVDMAEAPEPEPEPEPESDETVDEQDLERQLDGQEQEPAEADVVLNIGDLTDPYEQLRASSERVRAEREAEDEAEDRAAEEKQYEAKRQEELEALALNSVLSSIMATTDSTIDNPEPILEPVSEFNMQSELASIAESPDFVAAETTTKLQQAAGNAETTVSTSTADIEVSTQIAPSLLIETAAPIVESETTTLESDGGLVDVADTDLAPVATLDVSMSKESIVPSADNTESLHLRASQHQQPLASASDPSDAVSVTVAEVTSGTAAVASFSTSKRKSTNHLRSAGTSEVGTIEPIEGLSAPVNQEDLTADTAMLDHSSGSINDISAGDSDGSRELPSPISTMDSVLQDLLNSFGTIDRNDNNASSADAGTIADILLGDL